MKNPTNTALFEHGERQGNSLLCHGGGLCASSNAYLTKFADDLTGVEEVGKIYSGLFSFECFMNPDNWILPWEKFRGKAINSPGGAWGTARGVIVEAPETVEKIIAACKARNITHWFIAGGDGSSRAAAAVAPMLAEAGIQVIVPQILTLDGANGIFPLGVAPAVDKAWETINDVVATCLQTRNNYRFAPVIIKIMGRNRNDPLSHLLAKVEEAGEIGGIQKEEMDIYALPANCEDAVSKVEKMVKEISSKGDRRALILMSEGFAMSEVVKQAVESLTYQAMGKTYNVKVRTHEIGYIQQMSAYCDVPALIEKIVQESIPVIREGLLSGEPFTVVRETLESAPYLGPIEYVATRNPKHSQVPELAPGLQAVLEKYTP